MRLTSLPVWREVCVRVTCRDGIGRTCWRTCRASRRAARWLVETTGRSRRCAPRRPRSASVWRPSTAGRPTRAAPMRHCTASCKTSNRYIRVRCAKTMITTTVATSLSLASYVSWQPDTARICCCGYGPKDGRACCKCAVQQSIDIVCTRGPKQQTRCTLLSGE